MRQVVVWSEKKSTIDEKGFLHNPHITAARERVYI